MKRVAIGIPVYNGEEFVGEAIESILGQTFTDFELLISDNASTDRTEEICRHYAQQDARVRYFRQPRNLGAVVNFNAVAYMTDSEYFKWAAHDDLLAPTYLEKCIAALDADPTIVAATPMTVLIDEKGTPLPYSAELDAMIDTGGFPLPVMPEKNGELASTDPIARFKAVVFHTSLCVEVFGLMRRSALAPCMPLGTFLGADKIMIAQLCLRGPFWLGTEPLFFRRCHPRQFSTVMRTASTATRAKWYVNRPLRAFTHNPLFEKIRVLSAYCQAAIVSDLTQRQRFTCLSAVVQRSVSRRIWEMFTIPLAMRR